MDSDSQGIAVFVWQDVGLASAQIANECAGVILSGEFLSDDVDHGGFGPVGDHLDGIHQRFLAGPQLLEFVLGLKVMPLDMLGCLFDLLFNVFDVAFEVFDFFDEISLFLLPLGYLFIVPELWMKLQIGELRLAIGEL
jgi:hypothetical protein